MKLKIGISTCPNDTFIYEHLIAGLKNSPFVWDVFLGDVQTLNEMVIAGALDVAKISAQVYPSIKENYHLLKCGGAIGYGCGPLLLSSKNNRFDWNEAVLLPGENTTAARLFKFWKKHYAPSYEKMNFALFNEVYDNLCQKKCVQGVTIHEHRFTWEKDGLFLLQDLGAYWEEKTQAPIPLGIAVARREFSIDIIQKIESEIRESLERARSRCFLVSPFIKEKAQSLENEIIEKHIKMFVNDFSENIGEKGMLALEILWNETL